MPWVRDPRELEGSLVVIVRPMRDDLRKESRVLLELVSLRLGLLVTGEDGSPGRVRLFELAAGCLAIVEVDGSLAVICLPILERVLFELVSPFQSLAMSDLVEAEFAGCLVVI